MPEAYIGKSEDGDIKIPFDVFRRHFIALGSSGSGKTVLCKAIIEEAARNGIPSIIIDPQGDLSSLGMTAEKEFLQTEGINKDIIDSFEKNAKIAIFTPASSKGIPVCINPLKLPETETEEEELIGILKEISNSLASLLGYKEDDRGDSARSILYHILEHCQKEKKKLEDLKELIQIIQDMPDEIKQKIEGIASEKDKEALTKRLKLLTTGGKELMFNFGVQLDIQSIIKKGQVNIFYLNTLRSEEEKQFFISMLATNIYNWMLANPSNEMQMIFYIDEISQYLPAGAKKPIAKPILNLLYKQARKYGVGCMASTQNPGDIDYKAFAQFNTWAIGRMAVKQDIAKIKGALSSISPKFSDIMHELPKLKPAEFFLFSPDYKEQITKFKTRYLITRHKTLTAEELAHAGNIQLKQEIEKKKIHKKTEKKQRKTSKEHVKIEISKEKLEEKIKKLKKKTFMIFGNIREKTEYSKLLFMPIFLCTVRTKKRTLFKDKTEEFKICFDATTGNMLKLENKTMKTLKGFDKLIGLKDIDISIIREICKRRREMSTAEIYQAVKISGTIVKSSLNKMMKEGLLVSREKDRFGLAFEIGFNQDMSRQTSDIPEKDDEYIEKSEFIEEKTDIAQLKKTFEQFFKGSEIMDNEILHYPIYEIKLSTRKKSSIYKIDGVNGRQIE